jgi:hypothetical protein
MRLPFRARLAVLTVALGVAAVVLPGCGGTGGTGGGAEARAVEATVRRSIQAENAGDVRTFLSLWTDKGLRSYDAGSREDIESGRSPLGVDETDVRRFDSVKVDGDEAQAIVDTRVELGLYRSRFDLVRRDGGWRLDGFRFLGPAPAPAGTKVVPVKAVEYGYDVDRTALAGGDVAIQFVNAGQEQHEVSILSLPPDVTVAEILLALGGQRGRDFTELPQGYRMLGHLAYGSAGQTGTYALAEKLAPGRYAFVCFLPVGGVDDLGNARVRDAESHVARGMLADFTVG